MGNLQIKYAKLFTLSIEQLFYTNKVCQKYRVEPVLDLDIVPMAESDALMRGMDLVFRRTNESGGVVVLGRVAGKNGVGDDVLRFPARPAEKLTFGIILRNADVLAQNDLTLQLPGDKVYYFSNDVNDPAASRSELPLNTNSGGVSDADMIKTAVSSYRYHSGVPVPVANVEVKHLLSGKTTTPVSVMNEAGEADIIFNLASLPSGKCNLQIGGVVKDTFYYTGSSLAQPLFAVVEIMLSSTIGSNYRVIEPDRSLTKERPGYLILFKNRKTVWRYTFQLYPNSPLYLEMSALTPAEKTAFLAKLNVVSNDAAVTFKQTSVTDETIIFESETALLLKEAYWITAGPAMPLKLALGKNIGESDEAVVKDNLPYPPAGLVDVTPSFVYSDIFITI